MATHDYQIANGSGIGVRSDVNNALAAIVTQNSGPSAPSPTYPYMSWVDTTSGHLKQRNAANTAWIDHGLLSESILRTGVIASGGTGGLLRNDGDASGLSGVSDDVQAAIDGLAGDFTIIYPNGGTEGSPASVSNGNRYVEDNPFAGHRVICTVELLLGGVWADPGWLYIGTSSAGQGTVAGQVGDDIVVQTGTGGVGGLSTSYGGLHGYTGGTASSAPCRVLVWKMTGSTA